MTDREGLRDGASTSRGREHRISATRPSRKAALTRLYHEVVLNQHNERGVGLREPERVGVLNKEMNIRCRLSRGG